MRRTRPAVAVSEHQHQVAFFQWLEYAAKYDERLSMAYAIPNGGHRHPAVAKKLKSEGVKSGIPDICLPVPSGKYHGLYIEAKRKGGKPTDNQRGWIIALQKQGYRAVICEGFDEMKRAVHEYLGSAQR